MESTPLARTWPGHRCAVSSQSRGFGLKTVPPYDPAGRMMRRAAPLVFLVMLQTAATVELPVEQSANVFFARSTINGEGPFWMTVDTGATLTVLDPGTVERLGLQTVAATTSPDVGVGESATTVARTAGARIVVDGALPFRPSPLYVIPVRGAEAGLGHQIDGILGHDFLQRYIVEFDYVDGRLRLHQAGTTIAGEAAWVDVRIDGNRVLVPARLSLSDGEVLTARLLLDTGSSSGISLNTGFAARHRLEARFPSLELSAAVGVNGMSVRAVMYLKGVSIGGTALPVSRVAVSRDTTGLSASTDYDGILGAADLGNYRMIVDYSRRRLVLR